MILGEKYSLMILDLDLKKKIRTEGKERIIGKDSYCSLFSNNSGKQNVTE